MQHLLKPTGAEAGLHFFKTNPDWRLQPNTNKSNWEEQTVGTQGKQYMEIAPKQDWISLVIIDCENWGNFIVTNKSKDSVLGKGDNSKIEAQPLLQHSQTMNPTQKSTSLLVGLCLPVAPDTGLLTAHSPHCYCPDYCPSPHPTSGQPFIPAPSPPPASPRHSLHIQASGTTACQTGDG